MKLRGMVCVQSLAVLAMTACSQADIVILKDGTQWVGNVERGKGPGEAHVFRRGFGAEKYFLPDGQFIAYERKGGIWVVDARGNYTFKVADGKQPSWCRPALVPALAVARAKAGAAGPIVVGRPPGIIAELSDRNDEPAVRGNAAAATTGSERQTMSRRSGKLTPPAADPVSPPGQTAHGSLSKDPKTGWNPGEMVIQFAHLEPGEQGLKGLRYVVNPDGTCVRKEDDESRFVSQEPVPLTPNQRRRLCQALSENDFKNLPKAPAGSFRKKAEFYMLSVGGGRPLVYYPQSPISSAEVEPNSQDSDILKRAEAIVRMCREILGLGGK